MNISQSEKIKLHNATEDAIQHFRTWIVRRLIHSPASLHVMMQELTATANDAFLKAGIK